MRKLLICLLAMLTVIMPIAAAQEMAADTTILAKMTAVEKIIYGSEQTGALIERLARMEKDIFGIEQKEALIARLDKLYDYTCVTSATAPSFVTSLNAVEWMLTHNVSADAGKARIESVERLMLGNAQTGTLDERLKRLSRLAYGDSHPTVTQVTVPKDTLVKIKITTPLDTRKSRPGDVVIFTAAEDVYADGMLVIARGAQGTGKVTKVEPAKNFGRDAKLEVSFDTIQAVDSTNVDTVLGDKAKEETKSLAKAAGATVAGLAILGPVGVVGGAFVQGKEVTIPAGSELYIQTKSEMDIYGIKVK